MEIKLATIESLEQLYTFLLPQYGATYVNDRGITSDMFKEEVFGDFLKEYIVKQITNKKMQFYYGEMNNKIVGTIGIDNSEAVPEIWGFYVDQKNQNQGYGKTLWNYMTQTVLEENQKIMLTVAHDCKIAKAFYESRGFKVVGEVVWNWPNWIDQKSKNQYWIMEN